MADFKTLNGYNVKDEIARNGVATVQDNLDNAIDNINNSIGDINDNIETITDEYIVVIGDSYAQGYDGTQIIIGWAEKMANYLNMTINTDIFIKAEGSCGFYATNIQGHNFQNLMEIQASNMTNEQKEKVKMVMVGGGHNDTYNNVSQQQIEESIENFVNKQKILFPNAKTHIAYIGRTNNINVYNKVTRVLPAYTNCSKYGACYIKNSENIMYNKDWINSDNIHFNQNGYKIPGYAMYYPLFDVVSVGQTWWMKTIN